MQYEIKGTPFPVVICRLEPNETVCCQKGAMSWMSPNMQMSTNAGGGIGKMFSRAVSGESIFQNKYTAIGGNGDMVEHQVNGYLARERDAEDLAQGIRWCLENNKDGAMYNIVKISSPAESLLQEMPNNYHICFVLLRRLPMHVSQRNLVRFCAYK